MDNPDHTGRDGGTQVGTGHDNIGPYSLHRKTDPETGEVTVHKVYRPTSAPQTSTSTTSTSTSTVIPLVVGELADSRRPSSNGVL